MIKYTLVGLTALFLVSCTQVNTSSDKAITQGGDTVAAVDISVSKVDAIEELSKIDEPQSDKVLFKASGTEPGWLAEISQLKIRILFNYGEDSLVLDNKGTIINEKEDYNYTIKDNISISALRKPCTDEASGEQKDRQVIISYKGKKYTGCGSFIK